MTDIPIDPAESLPHRRDFPYSTIGSEAMVHDPAGRRVHFLNASAVTVWDACDGRTTVGECAERLRRSFNRVEGADLLRDVLETVADFRRLGLLEDGRDHAESA